MIPLPKLLSAGGGEERRIRPVQVSISETIVPLSTASMTLQRGETIADRSYVELYTVNGSAGVFRTRQPQVGYGGQSNTVSLESALCEIGDYIVRTKADQAGKTLSQALTQVFAYYGGSRWQLGSCIAGDVIFSLNYENLLSCINSLVAQVDGAMISCDYSTTPWTLNVVSKGTSVAAEGRLSRNVRGAAIRRDDSSLCTRVWMENLAANGAVGHLDADTLSTYGVVEKKLSGDGYTMAQALTIAQTYLDRNKIPKYSISVEGVDFSAITGETLDRVAIGKLYRLTIPEDGVTITENVTKLDWSDVYGNPESVSITLASEEKTLVDFIKQNENAASSAQSYAEGVSDSVSTLSQTVTNNDQLYWTKFNQTDRAIEAEAARVNANFLAQTEVYTKVDDIITAAHNDAAAAATSAKNACIAKTNVYQTAEAIVSSAVALSETSAGQHYIAKTVMYQTADEIYASAVQTAEDWSTGQWALLDGRVDTLSGEISVQAGRIDLVVTGSGAGAVIDSASIVLAINQSGSSVVINGDKIDLQGHVSITDLDEYGKTTAGWLDVDYLNVGGDLNCSNGYIQSITSFEVDTTELYVGQTKYSPTTVTIGGTQYTILAA